MEKTPLTAGTIVYHSHFGKGRIICQYDDSNVGDMVEIHWLESNVTQDHREENLRFGLTAIRPSATTFSPWAALAAKD